MWNLKPNDRLNAWRKLRIDISDHTLDEAITTVLATWSYAPFINTFLAEDLPDDWPDPWILLYDNQYDNLATALGMLYTLYLTDFRNEYKFEIKILREPGTNETFNTVWINDGQYVLNYEYNQVVSKDTLPDDLVVAYRYSATELKALNKV